MSMSRNRPKILVADDYPDAADATVELLRIYGYEAVSAYNGVHVLEVARTFRPHLIILDIDMPLMDGLAAARALRKQQAPGVRLGLIAHTGRCLPSDERAAFDAGFDMHVKKPLLGHDLCDLVAAFLSEANLPNDADRPMAASAVPETARPLNKVLE